MESYIKYAYVESMVYYKRNKKKVSAREKKIKYHSGSSAFLIKSSIPFAQKVNGGSTIKCECVTRQG